MREEPNADFDFPNRKSHDLKLDPEMFELVIKGDKTFEYRKNDRDFNKGDSINLLEYDRAKSEYTGRKCSFTAAFVLHGPNYGVPEGNCIISISSLRGNAFADNVQQLKVLRRY